MTHNAVTDSQTPLIKPLHVSCLSIRLSLSLSGSHSLKKQSRTCKYLLVYSYVVGLSVSQPLEDSMLGLSETRKRMRVAGDNCFC